MVWVPGSLGGLKGLLGFLNFPFKDLTLELGNWELISLGRLDGFQGVANSFLAGLFPPNSLFGRGWPIGLLIGEKSLTFFPTTLVISFW